MAHILNLPEPLPEKASPERGESEAMDYTNNSEMKTDNKEATRLVVLVEMLDDMCLHLQSHATISNGNSTDVNASNNPERCRAVATDAATVDTTHIATIDTSTKCVVSVL